MANSVTTIGQGAFAGTSLRSVLIPDTVVSIGDGAFGGCPRLTAIIVDQVNPYYSSRDGFLFDRAQTTLVQCPGARAGSYAIPESVTTIGASAFVFCTGLTNVTIATNVVALERSAFAFCTGLTSITIPDSVTSIGNDAFFACIGLTRVSIGNGVTTIGDSAFYACTNLTRITIPDSVTTIGDSAFAYCTYLTCATIGSGVSELGDWTFSDCVRLTEVYFLGGVPTAGADVFYDANDAAVVYYQSGMGGWDPWTTFAGRQPVLLPFYYDTATNNTITITGYTGPDPAAAIPATINGLPVTSIGDFAFVSSYFLTNVTIPDSVASIGSNAFQKLYQPGYHHHPRQCPEHGGLCVPILL